MVEDLFMYAETSEEDKKLFRLLGLKNYKVKAHDDYEVGSVTLGTNAIVDIRVHCMPAEFWTFTIHTKQPKQKLTLSTGSGPMSDYWPTVKLFALSMIVVDEFLTREES